MIIAAIVLGFIYAVQLTVVFTMLGNDEFNRKKDFLINLIPFYWVYDKYNDLN